MAEETGATGAQAAPETQPPAGESGAQAAPDGGESSSQPESMSLEEARKLRSEANSLRKRLKDFEDKDKTEAERAAARVQALEEELAAERSARRAMTLQTTAVSAAKKLGFRDPELASRLIHTSDIEFGEDGSPRNVERLLGDIAKEYPNLVGSTADYGGGPRGNPAQPVDMNQRIRRATGRA